MKPTLETPSARFTFDEADVKTVSIVLDEIERRAEVNMLKTRKLEGMHYAALRDVREELGIKR